MEEQEEQEESVCVWSGVSSELNVLCVQRVVLCRQLCAETYTQARHKLSLRTKCSLLAMTAFPDIHTNPT